MALAKKKAPAKKPVAKMTKKTSVPTAKAPSKRKVSRKGDTPAKALTIDMAAATAAVSALYPPTPQVYLGDVHALDLTGLEPLDRLLMLRHLHEQGFLGADGSELLYDLNAVSQVHYIGLNHINKLCSCLSFEEFRTKAAISKPTVNYDLWVTLGTPAPFHPETITQGDALYIRVK